MGESTFRHGNPVNVHLPAEFVDSVLSGQQPPEVILAARILNTTCGDSDIVVRHSPDGNATVLNPAAQHGMSENELVVLDYLANANGVLKLLVDIETGASVSKKTAGEIVQKFIENGWASRPRGERGGVLITDSGRAVWGTLRNSVPER